MEFYTTLWANDWAKQIQKMIRIVFYPSFMAVHILLNRH